MYASLLFWLALLLPGYVAVRRLSRGAALPGLLGVVALSYLATFGLLSPVSIACYLLHAPLWVFSGTVVVLIVAGAVELTRRGWWRDLGRLLIGGLCVELAIVAADMVLGGRVGAITGGDAVVHLTRVRSLLDHGFNNADPFVAGAFFFPIYHTNLLHALYAACTQMSSIHHLEVWFASLPWAKLVVAAGSYFLVWCVFERVWPARIAAVFTVATWGPISYAVYPNKLAPLWIGAMMLGFAVRAARSPCSRRPAVGLAVGSLVLGQLHSLYGGFMAMCLAPPLLGLLAWRWRRTDADRWNVLACVMALTLSLPFGLVAKSAMAKASQTSTSVAQVKDDHPAPRADGATRRGARFGWGSKPNWRTALLVIGIIAVFRSARKRQAAMMLATALIITAVMFVPPLSTVAIGFLGKKWILGRMGFVLYFGFLVFVPATAAYWLSSIIKPAWAQGLGAALIFTATVMTAPHRSAPYTWRAYWSNATAPRDARLSYLDKTREVVSFCRKNIPRGVTVLVEPWPGMVLTMIHDCRIVAPERGSNGVPNIAQRRRDLDTMLVADTPWPVRRALLNKYGIEHFFPAFSSLDWIRGHVRAARIEGRYRLFVLDTGA